jgi:hypothetical protein
VKQPNEEVKQLNEEVKHQPNRKKRRREGETTGREVSEFQAFKPTNQLTLHLFFKFLKVREISLTMNVLDHYVLCSLYTKHIYK